MWRRKGRKRWRGDGGGGGGGEKGAGKGGEKEGREEEAEQVEEPQVRGADTKNLENGLFAGLQLLLEFVRTSSGLRAWLTRSRVWLTPLSFLLAMNNMVVRAAYRISPERVGKALRDCRSRHTYSQKRLRIA